MRIIALDQATAVSGVAIFEDGVLVEHKIVSEPNKIDINTRTLLMAHALCKEMASCDVVVIEDVQAQGSVAVTIQLARLQGALLFFAHEKGIKSYILRPSEWRSKLGFTQGRTKRAELKAQSIEFVKERYNIVATDDEADAICIGAAFTEEFR